MKLLYFSLLLSSLVIAQAQCGLIQDDSDDDDSHEIVFVPTAVLTVIETIIDFITNTGISVINGLSNGVGTIEEHVHNLEKIAVDFIWEIVSNKLKEMESEPDSSNFTKATIQCVEEQGDDIKTIVYDFASQSVTCDIEKTVLIINTYKPVLVDIKNSNEVMKSLTEEIINCGNDAAAVPCINEVEDEMFKELSQLVENLKDDIESASKFIENINMTASLCLQDVSDKFQTQLNTLSSTISECIQQKYINNTIVSL